MKKVLALMLVLLMAFIVGCITDSDSKDDNSDTDNGGSGSGSTAKAAEYLPLQVGVTWKWESTDSDDYSYGSTETITGTTSLGGREYYVISDDDGDDTYIRLANDIVYMYMEEEWAEKAHARGATFETKDVPMFDFNKSAGKTWSIYSDTQSEEGYSSTVKITGKYVGLKSVTVPAGTFSNCAVFEITMESQYKSTYIYETYTGTYTSVSTHYFAKGIGPVKIASNDIDISNGEKYEYSDTQECTYYSIPGGASGGDPNSGGNGDTNDNGGGSGGTGIGTGSYTVTGRVVDSSGKGISGIKVTIFDEYKEASATTDANGYYTFSNIATGSYGMYCDETDNYAFSPWIGHVDVEGKDASADENFVGTPPSN